jgi:hypothetical protein
VEVVEGVKDGRMKVEINLGNQLDAARGKSRFDIMMEALRSEEVFGEELTDVLDQWRTTLLVLIGWTGKFTHCGWGSKQVCLCLDYCPCARLGNDEHGRGGLGTQRSLPPVTMSRSAMCSVALCAVFSEQLA